MQTRWLLAGPLLFAQELWTFCLEDARVESHKQMWINEMDSLAGETRSTCSQALGLSNTKCSNWNRPPCRPFPPALEYPVAGHIGDWTPMPFGLQIGQNADLAGWSFFPPCFHEHTEELFRICSRWCGPASTVVPTLIWSELTSGFLFFYPRHSFFWKWLCSSCSWRLVSQEVALLRDYTGGNFAKPNQHGSSNKHVSWGMVNEVPKDLIHWTS